MTRTILINAQVSAVALMAVLLPVAMADVSRASVDFARDVRPLLEKSCLGCHGPEKQKSGYRLDVRELALKGGESGERAIVPHDAKASPLNRLLWQNRHRLDADAVRDFTLAASGALDLTTGGPSIRHFKASKGLQATPALDYTAHDWASPGAGRRSIYRNVWRGMADTFMEALDFPDLGLLAPARSFSVSSLQALTLCNNVFVLHHSAAPARRAEVKTTTLGAQIANAVRLVWLRDPTADEIRDFADPARANGLPAFCRVLLNSNEFLFIP